MQRAYSIVALQDVENYIFPSYLMWFVLIAAITIFQAQVSLVNEFSLRNVF